MRLFLQLQLISTTFSTAIVLFFCLHKSLFFSVAQKQSAYSLLKTTIPFLLIVLLMATHYRLDGFLLYRLHPNGAREAGMYASAYRLLDAGNMIGYLCASFLVPFAAKHRQEKKMIEDVVLFIRHGLLAIALFAVMFVFAFAPWLQRVLYHTSDAQNNKIIALCFAVLPAYYLTHVYGSLLTAIGAFRLFISVLVFSVLLNAALNFILVPSMGAAGCCVAALASQYGCAISLWLFASQRLAIRTAVGWFGVYALWAAAGGLFFFCVKNSATLVWIILAAACFIVVLFALTQKARLKRFMALINA